MIGKDIQAAQRFVDQFRQLIDFSVFPGRSSTSSKRWRALQPKKGFRAPC